MRKLFELNELNKNLIQIYGVINGYSQRIETMGRMVYIYDIRFIKNNKLVKISNSNIKTISTKEALIEKINKIYEAEE